MEKIDRGLRSCFKRGMTEQQEVLKAIMRAAGGRPEHLAIATNRSTATIHNWFKYGVRFAKDAAALIRVAGEHGLTVTLDQLLGDAAWVSPPPNGRSSPRSSAVRARAPRRVLPLASDNRPAAQWNKKAA